MEFSPLDPRHWDDPYPMYRALRDHDSLHYAPDMGAFLVTRYDEVTEVFRQPELFPSRDGFNVLLQDSWKRIGALDVLEMVRFLFRARLNPLMLRGAPESIISSDPPAHGPLRHIVNRGFTPRRIGVWEDRIRELSLHYLEGVRAHEPFELVQTLAHPLPMRIVAELLGVEGNRIADFRRWSTGVIDTLTGSGRHHSPRHSLANGGELLRYLRTVVTERQRSPQDDLISVLVDPKHGETLDMQGVLLFATVLLVAGNETTTNSLGNAVDLLMRHPEALEAVTDDPSLIPTFFEESLRLEAPLRFTPRSAAEDTEIRGTRIPKGSRLLVMVGAANRDERYFTDPDRFDMYRDASGHLTFGHGIHFCLGASLARLEGRVALETLLPLLQGRKLVPGAATRADSYFTRGFARLELTAATAAAAA